MNANAEIILVRTDGALILQQRDNKTGITNPGFISTFGGHVEEGDEPLDAAWREIQEETSLRPLKSRLKFFGKYKKTMKEHGEDWSVYYFLLDGVNDKNLKVYEGQGYIVLKNQDEIADHKLTTLLKKVLNDYYGVD